MKLQTSLFCFCLLAGLQGSLNADYIGESKAPLVLPTNALEVSYQYRAMNDTLDIFNVKQSEFSSSNTVQTNGLGDYTSHKIVTNYSPSTNSLLNFNLSSQTIGYGSSTLDVLSYGGYGRYIFKPSSLITLGVDIGFRGNKGKKVTMSSATDIQYYLNNLGKNITASETDQYLWLTKNYDNLSLSAGFPKSSHPEISIDNMSDQTFYGRTSIAMGFETFSPSLYMELGHTAISTTIDTNMDDIAGDSFKSLFATYTNFPISLDRNENYASAGFNLAVHTPFNTVLTTNYEYKKLFRENGLNFLNTNHTLEMVLSYNITPNLGVNVGGTYLYRQFNGTIPFLYNKYSQTSFDHPFGWCQLGINYIFKQ
ncbi:MAG: hypothetical protein NTY39_01690 [Campylobacterales bacterium]|nr:hypothetical protein [Campylobacterales bacterium]